MSLIRLQQGRGVNICFSLTVENTKGIGGFLLDLLYINLFLQVFLSYYAQMHKADLCLHFSTALCHSWYKLKFKRPRSLCFPFLSFSPSSFLCCFYTIKPPLYISGLVQASLPVLLQSLDNQFTLTWPG